MIITDRDLAPEEHEKCPQTGHIIDLRNSPEQTFFRDILLNWLEETVHLQINGLAVHDFFGLNGSSYWLHVRARIFYQLFRIAQQMDRLPDSLALDDITAIYTRSSEIPLWSALTPKATLFVNNESVPKRAKKTSLDFGYFLHLARASKALKPLPKGGVWIFSNIFYNQQNADGTNSDRVFDPLFRALGPNARRLELLPIPPKGLEKTPQKLRIGSFEWPNATLDAILVDFIKKHPQHIVYALRNFRTVKKRFNSPLTFNLVFPRYNDFWQAQLAKAISQTAASIPILDLCKNALYQFFIQQKPKVLVGSSENNSIGRCVIEAAKSLGILTIGYQHGSIDRHNADYRFSHYDMPQAIPDYFCCWGDDVRDYLIAESHYPPERTLSVGRMQTGLEKPVLPEEKVLCFKETHKKPLLLFASQAQGMFDEVRNASAPLLARFCADHGLCCVVKPHPRETDDGLYRRAFQKAKISNRLLELQGDLFPMLSASDFGATCYSTVGWEMMWLGLPLILFDPLKLDLLKLRAAPYVYTFTGGHDDPDFGNWQKNLIAHKSAGKSSAIRRLGPIEGGAASRIVEILENDLFLG